MMGITVIALVMLGSLMMQARTLQNRLDYYNSKASALEKSIESEKDRTKEIDAEKEYMKTDEYVEEAAREKLGLVKDNEIVFQEEK
ncbi:cell division protein FtsH [Blautia schinkii]|nr:cell division protein FtsH [Blautia schinkii]NSK22527.1 cell division protein FtsH [Blautia schinkii]NSK25569.1 cell division protein FtsH [Blautia schinkii]NSK31714.1 cell division protein FtsH [Blautia schinkii]NSK35469.1 cell division protein FtsH [Blautia schinkii]